MPPFNLVPAPVFSPTRCTTCGANRCDRGFVDLVIDDVPVGGFDEAGQPRVAPELGVGFGHLYLCADCAGSAAAAIRWCSPEQRNELAGELACWREKAEELERELERERERKVVPVADVVSLIEQREAAREVRERRSKRSPAKPAA